MKSIFIIVLFFTFLFACTNKKKSEIHHTKFNPEEFNTNNFIYDTNKIRVFLKEYENSFNIYDSTEFNSLKYKLHFTKEDGPPNIFYLKNFENRTDTSFYVNDHNYYIVYRYDSLRATLNRTSFRKKDIISNGSYILDSSFFYAEQIYNNTNGDWLDSMHLLKGVKAIRHGNWFYFDSLGNIETSKKYDMGKIVK